MLAGAAILEAAADHLSLETVKSVDTGLRNGVHVDLVRGLASSRPDPSAGEAALAVGRRFDFDEPHGAHVATLATRFFEDLAAVSFQKHHEHTYYLVAHADILGSATASASSWRSSRATTEGRRRYRGRPDLAHLATGDIVKLRKLAALLRLANALDASHLQIVRRPPRDDPWAHRGVDGPRRRRDPGATRVPPRGRFSARAS